MKFDRSTVGHGLFFLAFLLAFALRFSNLGTAPLSDVEAEKALQALDLSRGTASHLASGPAYAILTGPIFSVFHADNCTARIIPGMAGLCLLVLAWLLRSRLGSRVAIVLAFGLALDPGLVVLSRFAGGPILTAGFGLLAFGLASSSLPVLAGVFGGLALLGGATALHGALSIGLAAGIGYFLIRRGVLEPVRNRASEVPTGSILRTSLLAGCAVVLFAGTLLFRFPGGLGSFAGILPAYLDGWYTSSGIPASRLIGTLLIYQLLPLIFAIAAAIHAWRRKYGIMQWVSLWTASAFLWVLAYPGRQVEDLIWVIVPLWILASWEISNHLRTIDIAQPLAAAGQAALLTTLLALGWLNLAGLGSVSTNPETYRLRLAVSLGVLALGLITAILVGLGWSFKTARRGVVWSLLIVLGAFLLRVMWGAAMVRGNGEQELWLPTPVVRQERELTATLNAISKWNTGMPEQLDVTVVSPEPSLRWILRDWPQARFLTSIPAGEMPSVVINAEDQAAPGLAASYRGQDFAWWISAAWTGAVPGDWVRWIVFRDAPEQIRHVILWARADIFPGGAVVSEESPAPLDSPQE
jgi:hypothetical protein